MISIIKNDGNTVYYECGCGTKGKCMIRPLGKSDVLVTNLSCAICEQTERVVLIQYKTNEEKDKLLQNLSDAELSWSLVLSNEIIN